MDAITEQIIQQKKEIRAYIRRCKAAQTSVQLAAWSESLCHNLISSSQWQKAKTILLYHALPDEVQTLPLLAQHTAHKQLLLPVVKAQGLQLRVYCGEGAQQRGAMQISEPTGPPFTALDEIDLAIIPGMAFDTNGHRLGRGKGYYDRLLPTLQSQGTYTIGICFPFQYLAAVPYEAHDVAVDTVLY